MSAEVTIAVPTIEDVLSIARSGKIKTKKIKIALPPRENGDTTTVDGRHLIGSNLAIGKTRTNGRSALYWMHPEEAGRSYGVIARFATGMSMLKGAEDLMLAWMHGQIADLPPIYSLDDFKGEIYARIEGISVVMKSSDACRFDEAFRQHRDEVKVAKEKAAEIAARETCATLAIELELMSAPPTDGRSINFHSAQVPFDKVIKRLGPIVSTDSERPNLHHIRFVNGRAIATDGHVIAILPTDGSRDGDIVGADGVIFEPPDLDVSERFTKSVLGVANKAAQANDTQEVIDGPFLLAVIDRMCKLHDAMGTRKNRFVDFHVTDGQLRVSLTPTSDMAARHPDALERRVTANLVCSSRAHACDGPMALGGIFGVNPFYMRKALKGVTGSVVLGYRWDADRETQLIEVCRDGEVHIIAGCDSNSVGDRLDKEIVGNL